MNPIQRPHDIRIPTLEQIFAQLVRVGHFMRSTHQAPDTMEDTPEVQSEIPADDHVHTLIQPDAESLCLTGKVKESYDIATANGANPVLHALVNTTGFRQLDEHMQLAVIERYASAPDVKSKTNIAKLVLDSRMLQQAGSSLKNMMLEHFQLANESGVQALPAKAQKELFITYDSDPLFPTEFNELLCTMSYRSVAANPVLAARMLQQFTKRYNKAAELYRCQISKLSTSNPNSELNRFMLS
jgi:hypothetical protein